MSIFDSIFGLSAVEKTVEAATSDLLIASDWAKNAEIWEAINRAAKQDGGKEYLKAIRARIQHKNPKVVMLSLILLEATVKNCGMAYHALLSKPDYLQTVVKTALKKEQKSDVRDKALSMIMSWAEAFARVKELNGFVTTYQELRKKGVDFPARDTTSLAPVVTPPPKPRPPEPARSVAPSANAHPYSYVSEAFVTKTRADLALVVNCIQLARDMLQAAESGAAAKANGTLTVVLRNVKEMDVRLSRLISEIDHELLVGVCIRLSEEIRVVMDWYQYRLSDTPYQAKPFVVPPALVPEAAVPADGSGSGSGSGSGAQKPAELNLLDRKADSQFAGDSKSSPARLPAPGGVGAPPLVLAAAAAAADSKSRAPRPQASGDILNLSGVTAAGAAGGGGGNSKDPEADAFDALASRDVQPPVVAGGSLAATGAAFAITSQRTIEQSSARFPAPVIRPAGAGAGPGAGIAELSFTSIAPAASSSSSAASGIAIAPAAGASSAAAASEPAITFEPIAIAAAAPSAAPSAAGGDGFDEFAALASRPTAGAEGEEAVAIAPVATPAPAVPMAVAPAPANPRLTSNDVNAGVSAKEFEALLDLTDVPSGPGAAAAPAGPAVAPAAGVAADSVDLDELLRLASAQKAQHAQQS